jgi:hypothetical protein
MTPAHAPSPPAPVGVSACAMGAEGPGVDGGSGCDEVGGMAGVAGQVDGGGGEVKTVGLSTSPASGADVELRPSRVSPRGGDPGSIASSRAQASEVEEATKAYVSRTCAAAIQPFAWRHERPAASLPRRTLSDKCRCSMRHTRKQLALREGNAPVPGYGGGQPRQTTHGQPSSGHGRRLTSSALGTDADSGNASESVDGNGADASVIGASPCGGASRAASDAGGASLPSIVGPFLLQ